jgi:hypothetical protein
MSGRNLSTPLKITDKFPCREMFALIDLLIGKNLNVCAYICAEGRTFTSSFSVLLKHLNQYKKIITI